MTRYIVVSENEIVKAEMERPEFSAWEMISPAVNKVSIINGFVEHCLSLPRIPAPGHKWKLWDEVEEGKDFEFGEGRPIFAMTDKGIKNTSGTVAFPIEQTKSEQVEFSESEMKKVQDDIDSVNAGAIVDKVKLSGFPCDINELCDVLQNTCQLLNGIKPDAVEEKWWSDWDESVLQSNIKMLRQVQPFYRKQPTHQR